MSTVPAVDAATRVVFWQISHVWLMYVIAAVALGVFAYGVWRRARLWRALGTPTGPLGAPAARLRHAWRQIGMHRRLLRDRRAGWMHAALAGSMVLLTLGTTVVFVHVDLGLPIMQGWFYLVFQKLGLTLAGLALIAACIAALARRYVVRVPRLQPKRPQAPRDWSDVLSPALLLLLALQGFTLQAVRLAAVPDPHAWWSPVGHLLSLALSAAQPEPLASAYRVLWWTHLVTALGWIAWLPYGKMLHLFTGTANVYASDPAARPARPRPLDFDAAEHLGASKITHFTWKALLDLDACTACGRCEAVCPAHASGAPLNPRSLILDLRDHMRRHGPALAADPQAPGIPALVGETIAEATLWACTTCGACVRECPVHVEHVPKIIDMRRHLAMEQASVPGTMQDALKSLEDRGHPYKGATGDRMQWAKGLDVPLASAAGEVELLYWVGCTTSLDPRAQEIARAFVELLGRANVRFAVLGRDEPCCGDPARRMGHEFLYDQVARANVELLQGVNPKRIVTTCPHCLNAIGTEYRAFGGEFAVVHHTQLLDELVAAGRLPAAGASAGKVTYHDPCYLGRYGGEFEAPRALLDAAGAKRVEMPRSRTQSFCCGGGGGQAWMPAPPPGSLRINEIRVREALATGADTLGVACPFCIRMLEDGAKAVGGETRLAVRDVAEILRDALPARDGAGPAPFVADVGSTSSARAA